MTTKVRGVMLAPGLSANKRYYSPEMIRAAVSDAQARVQNGQMHLKAYHDAADTVGVVGAVRSLRVDENGLAHFEGELADNSAARDVAALIRGKSPFVNGVSIEGRWTGKMRTIRVGNETAETADGLSLTSLAFTAQPGVSQARIVAESLLSGIGSRVIFEQAPGPVVPVPPERSERDWAAMTSEERDRAAGEVWSATFAGWDQRRQAQGASPFWRGLATGER